MPLKICPSCSKSFLPNRYWQIYCSKNCKFTGYYLRKMKNQYGDSLDLLNLLDTQEAARNPKAKPKG